MKAKCSRCNKYKLIKWVMEDELVKNAEINGVPSHIIERVISLTFEKMSRELEQQKKMRCKSK